MYSNPRRLTKGLATLLTTLALAGLLPPWLAGLGMAASSLVVVLNALRLAHAPSREGSAPPLPAASPAA